MIWIAMTHMVNNLRCRLAGRVTHRHTSEEVQLWSAKLGT